ncbi:MAG: hypothetical protein L3J86_04115, partial [Thermoplasmata archaeon]|nr:hypothetical protein [Thermoplasmata archaeon]
EGGQGAYALRWTAAPSGCRESGLTDLSCTPSTAGQFTVALTVTDSRGFSGNGTTSFAVGDEYIVHPGGSANSAATLGIPPWLPASAIVAVALIAIVLGVVTGRRGGGGSSPPLAAVDPRYSAYRAPPVEAAPPKATPASDPVDDLF